MPTVSLPTAEFLFNVSSVALIAGALAVFAGTIGTVWMGSVKERYGDERISANEKETAQAKKDAAEARLEQEKLAAANLRLEARIAPRHFTFANDDQKRSLIVYAGQKVRVISYALDVEGAILASDIIDSLRKIGFEVEDRRLSEVSMGGIALGIWVEGKDLPFASTLSNIFAGNGLISFNRSRPRSGTMSMTVDAGEMSDADIFVGAKPLPQP